MIYYSLFNCLPRDVLFLLTLRKDRPYQRATSCAYAHTIFLSLYIVLSYPYLWVKNEFLRVILNFYVLGDNL
nr:MAG TPA: hypothetical protein [Bacteriophage sp.]DAX97724.1 MAG TPA: hypothetical protein [Caudoviricetes sp.]